MSKEGGSDEVLNEKLMKYASEGNLEEATRALKDGAEQFYQADSTGRSVMMAAAGNGHAEMVRLLLQNGAPWNAIDRKGKCAGEYALQNGHQDVVEQLVDAGVAAELLLAAIDKNRERTRKSMAEPSDSMDASNKDYLDRNVRYEGDNLLDDENDAVMMEWETPIMHAHAKILCTEPPSIKNSGKKRGVDILNVGFGMGIVDKAIQKFCPRRHTIIEAHPGVYKKMQEDKWQEKQGVEIQFGRWQDVVDKLLTSDSAKANEDGGQYDAIFFDTYGEFFADLQEFHAVLPKLLRPGGIYSFFNGLSPDNIFFQGVACQLVKLQMGEMRIDAEFHRVQVQRNIKGKGENEDGPGARPDGEEKDGNGVWKDVTRRYYYSDEYFLPICTKALGPSDTAAGTEGGGAGGKRKRAE
jgi:protein arginine N-methyltransferase 2